MDSGEAARDFQDWELLQTNSDSDSAPLTSLHSFDEVDSGGMIQANYFSLESQDRYKSTESDNPSWIDPGLEDDLTLYLNKESGRFWSDSGSDKGLDGINVEMDFSENENKEPNFEGIGELHEKKWELGEDLSKICMDSSGIDVGSAENSQVDVEDNVNLHVEMEVLDGEKNENEAAENSQADVEDNVNMHVEMEALGEQKKENEKIAVGGEGDKKSGEVEKRSLVWWKMPMEFLKYCVLRMSPVWTVSVAAAFMGFLIVGRRLYKMKRKTRGLEIKVTVDDKKVSQVMSRVARLNEAFSVVKRVPVIRPSLPAVGSTSTWPAMSMRQA